MIAFLQWKINNHAHTVSKFTNTQKDKAMARFIVYTCGNAWANPEVIVTTPELEAETIRQFFTEADRDIEEYDRRVYNEVCIPVRVSRLHVL